MKLGYPDHFDFVGVTENTIHTIKESPLVDIRDCPEKHNVKWKIPPGYIVLDVDTKNGADISTFEDSIVATTPSGGTRNIFRIPDDFHHVKEVPAYPAIEFFSHTCGKTIMMPPSITDAGAYKFVKRVDWDNLPSLPLEVMEAIKRQPPPEQSEASLMPVQLFIMALQILNPADYQDNNDWLPIAMAFHSISGGSEDALDEFIHWCRMDPAFNTRNNEKQITSRWRSFNPDGGYSVGTIMRELNKYGDIGKKVADTFSIWLPDKPPTITNSITKVVGYAPIKWHAYRFLPANNLVAIAGPQGTGKSTLIAALAALFTTGGQWPNTGEQLPKGRILWLTAEENPDQEIAARVLLNGGDLDMIDFLSPMISIKGKPRMLDFAEDREYLKRHLLSQDYAMMVIDPLTAFHGDKETNSNGDVRTQLTTLVQLAQNTETCIFGLLHINIKGKSNGSLKADVQGASSYTAVPRVVLGLVDEDGIKHFGPCKANLTSDQCVMQYSINYQQMPGDDVNSFGVLKWHSNLFNHESIDDVYRRVLKRQFITGNSAERATDEQINEWLTTVVDTAENPFQKETAYSSVMKRASGSGYELSGNSFNRVFKVMMDTGYFERVLPEGTSKRQYYYSKARK